MVELNVEAVTLMMIVAWPPMVTEPSEQLTVPPLCEQVPWVVETEPKLTSVGKGSETVTFCATAGPLLDTVTV